nr:MAG TPA: hypothetical protein [Caudoviricetes sp.]
MQHHLEMEIILDSLVAIFVIISYLMMNQERYTCWNSNRHKALLSHYQ